jgi:hypothetical protein
VHYQKYQEESVDLSKKRNNFIIGRNRERERDRQTDRKEEMA